ncbi:microtubule-associated protein futsch isoform X2 [Aplysia californica]|uniref:Microtubule-associated protein futsch isoform X2 n=1 Tax=Aplysia californica TaxID=6500 RepID=A0ABM0JDC4_APLCA|nr:microtubule-associated protein futsch isoform X2 [Aplysia californica]
MDSDDQGFPSPGAALLLIIGEPFSDDHKSLILEEITKGFRCWDVEDTGIDINDELAQIANRASLGEEGANGERLIQHQSENLSVEILINPLAQSVKNSLKKLLIASSPTKYVLYAGHAFQGTGAWVLQDDTFSFSSLAQVFKNTDVENALKQNIEANLTIHTSAESHWGTSISKADFTNNLRIQLNPPEKLHNIHGVVQFTAYVGSFVTQTPVTNLLQASEQFGNIGFTRPTLYIFPGCQGDSALFGINGFNLLVNGGYNRRACFWDFARHLDRVDAMLLTHLGPDNIFGINTALQRKSLENIHPQIGYLYFNAIDKPSAPAPCGDGDGDAEKKSSLLINLAEEANNLTRMAKQLGISPQPCSRSATSQNAEPINLYHKLGHGSLDMYMLNPITDSKEMKEFYQLWNKKASNLGSSGPFPLQNALSVCTMLVWRPHNPNEKIVRIFFPGNAPQHKIAEGLEKMKSFAYLKHASCTPKDLLKPAVVKKAGGSARPGSGATRSARTTATSRAETTRSMNASRMESPRKAESRTASRLGAMSPTKATTRAKEENGKRPTDVKKRPTRIEDKEKDTNTRPASARSSTMSSPSKATSPRKTPSPTKSASPTKGTSPAKSPSPPKSVLAKSPTKAKSPEKSKPEEKPAPPAEVKNEEVSAAPVPSSLVDTPATEPAPVGNNMDKPELKPESDQAQGAQQDQIEALQTVDNTASEKTQPSETNSNLLSSSVDAMNASMTMSADRQKLESLGIYDADEQKDNQVDAQSPVYTNGDNEEEEVRPQALPEPPVIMESPSQDSDIMPDYSSKIESDEQELSEFNKAEEELQEFEADIAENTAVKSFEDPAEDIPPSPEPAAEEQPDFNDYPVAVEAPKTFETPVFSNDDADTNGGVAAMEQKIQYGIDESSRAMAGIQEEEEPEEEGEVSKDIQASTTADKQALRDLGIYDDDDELEEEVNGFDNEVEEEVRQNVAQQQFCEQVVEKEEVKEKEDNDQEKDMEEEEVASDCRLSAERQFEDVEEDANPNSDEGIEEDTDKDVCEENDSSVPAAFDRDSSPEMEVIQNENTEEQKTVESIEESPGEGVEKQLDDGEREDTDSIDGGTPDDDKDIDETIPPNVNGTEQDKSDHFAVMDSMADQSGKTVENVNPFSGVQGESNTEPQSKPYAEDSDNELQEEGASFDPVAQWGKPMGLPSPPPTSPQKGASTDRRPASAASKPGDAKSRTARNGTATTDAKKRPATAPTRAGATGRPMSGARRAGSSRSSPQSAKVPPLPPMTAFYMDLTYIPNHGDPSYSDVEFFKRVRARYYVLSALSPNLQVLDSLMEAKATWEQKDLEVTLIPTYDNETLRHWVGLNKEKLQELRIDLTPAVSRCTIQLQDLETSLPAYRLEV